MSDFKDTITILTKDDARVWKMLQDFHQDLLDRKEISYIGMPSRKIWRFKDRSVLKAFAERLKGRAIKFSIDNAYPDEHPWNK